MKTTLLIILFALCIFTACKKENYTSENYVPKRGHDIETVRQYWGPPSSSTTSNISGTVYFIYYYDTKRVVIYFIGTKVDSWTTY